jgi:hypothetical protein
LLDANSDNPAADVDLRLSNLHTPVLVRGTLAKPSFTIQPRHAAVKLIDRGVAKDADCGSLIAAAEM